eukprot:gene20322-7340_t
MDDFDEHDAMALREFAPTKSQFVFYCTLGYRSGKAAIKFQQKYPEMRDATWNFAGEIWLTEKGNPPKPCMGTTLNGHSFFPARDMTFDTDAAVRGIYRNIWTAAETLTQEP